jgi:hypothetical protein
MKRESDEMRSFFRRRLGNDWELRLILANAIAGPDATDEEVDAAQQRAIELVTETSYDWSIELRELTAQAWLTLWCQ